MEEKKNNLNIHWHNSKQYTKPPEEGNPHNKKQIKKNLFYSLNQSIWSCLFEFAFNAKPATPWNKTTTKHPPLTFTVNFSKYSNFYSIKLIGKNPLKILTIRKKKKQLQQKQHQ